MNAGGPLNVAVVGAGPAGLFFALLMKKRFPAYDIRVVEQNPRAATYGFGVVFSEQAQGYIEEGDPETYRVISAAMESWPYLKIVHRDEAVLVDGNGFSSIARLRLLRILQDLCAAAGVGMQFGRPVTSLDEFADCDLVVGADGINSRVRRLLAEQFQPAVRQLENRFAWYGTAQVFDCLTLTFRCTDDGAFVAHHYRYSPHMSTFIVECDAGTWRRAGFGAMSDAGSRAYCERVFAPDLGGHPLISNQSVWRRFPVVTTRGWRAGNTVLIGDALRSVHFSIGSGTRLALEDAIALFQAFDDVHGATGAGTRERVEEALSLFESRRRPVVEKILEAAQGSFEWYERFAGRMHLDPYDFAYDYMTRSGRVSDERLRGIAPRFVATREARSRRAPG